MEFKISDLLDDLQEVPIDILPYTAASESRIKDLTMAKVRNQGTKRSRIHGRGVLTKVLIAAILVTALTFSVMAATGIQFSDWTEGIEKPHGGYDKDLNVGGISYHWEVSNWMVLLTTVNATETGIMVEAMEYGAGERHGSLTMDGTWWLEQWNGSEYEPVDVAIPAAEQVVIEKQAKYRWHADWSASHGALESGSYRLGIPFAYTADDGTTQEVEFYAKFRVFTKEMESYIKKCSDAVKARYQQDVLHFKETHYQHNTNIRSDLGYVYYTQEVWKYGDDFLTALRYYDEKGAYIEEYGGGHLRRDGVGYTLDWNDEQLTEVSEWERASFVEGNDVSYGFYLRAEVSTPTLGEICDDGNTIYIVSYSDFRDESKLSDEEIQELNKQYPIWNHDYDEHVYTFDDTGNLMDYEHIVKTARDAEESEWETTYKLEIFDTAPEEIEKMIRSQDGSKPTSFLWQDDQTRYGEIAKTSGFRNTTAEVVTSMDDAVDIARSEAVITEHPTYREGDEYNLAKAFYDEGAGVWKVEFRFSQDDSKRIYVYLNGDGITLMTVYP